MPARPNGNGLREGAAQAYEEKHLELLRAAAALFAERGYHDASIRDLARVTGRSLSGLYYYFSGKEELLFQIQHHCYSTLLKAMREALEGARTPEEKLLVFISHHLAFFRHNMDEMKVLAHEDVTLTGGYGRRILELRRAYSRMLIEIVEEYEAGAAAEAAAAARRGAAAETGESAESGTADGPGHPSAEVAAFVLFGAMNWLYAWPRRLRRMPAEDLAAAVAQMFLCGYPGCPSASLAGMRENILCAPQEFWKPAPAVPPETTTE
jgi:AcrR family transcriptional regulator